MRPSYFLSICLAAFLSIGCKSTEPAAQSEATYYITDAPAGYTVVADSLPADPQLESLIDPYRQQLQAGVSEVIGYAEVLLEKGNPESLLGNMAADAMLQVANGMADAPVDMALTNNGGLRTPIAPGPITVGKIFELMPFDNMMTLLEFSAAQVDSLAQQLAAQGGEPIAGFSFSIDEASRTAAGIRVGGAPLDPDRTYRLVTNDYLANGGGDFRALWQPLDREDLNVLLRDAFIAYIRDKGTIHPQLDGRISVRGR